ncbi:hypothetical protein JKF63_06299 [Porcisia hertigi]|uniref:Trichohyalin-plectin-homology domain-containing protein n=1 Tax=Porcisia hertigi TaxID=2761500 RepID=A0A836ICK4_9TRYP|nr:hypothetical protein JKF63_06299 [Porcisia hertigi]
MTLPRGKDTGGMVTTTAPMSCTRARRDPRRRIGNSNAVADGLDMTRVGILSDRELAFFHRLAYAGSHAAEQQQHDARKQEEYRRRNLSKARTAEWTDTIEARHDRFVQEQKDATEAAEARQKVLDDLYLEQRKEEHKAMIARQQLEKIKEDPRTRHVRSVTLLHEALKAREEQVAYRDMVKREEKKRNAADQLEYQQQLWGDQAEELHKKLQARQRNMEEKNTNLEAVLYQIDRRREERAADCEDRKRVDQEAADERAEQREEEMARRARDLENGAYNVAHSRTAVTKAEKLQAHLAENAKDQAALEAEEKKVESLKRYVVEHQRRKQLAFEDRKKASLPQYLKEAQPDKHPTYRTQDAFVQKGTSLLQHLHDGDAKRQEKQREQQLEMTFERLQMEEEKAAEARGETIESKLDANGRNLRHHRASTTAAGFMSMAEEKAYAEEMRRYPEQLRAKEAEEAAARRAEALRLEQAQKLQAAEKHEKERRALEAHREEVREQQAQQEADDARFRAYIDSVIPADMDPFLYRKAVQMH